MSEEHWKTNIDWNNRPKVNWDNRLEVIEKIQDNDMVDFYIAPDYIKKDKSLIHLAASYDLNNFEYAHNELKCDKEFIKELLITHKNKYDTYAIMYDIDDKLLNDKEFIKELILLDNEILNYHLKNNFIGRFLGDKDFILFAIKINIEVFNYIPDELKNNKKFMLEMLKVNFDVLKNIAIYHFEDDLSKWYYKYKY